MTNISDMSTVKLKLDSMKNRLSDNHDCFDLDNYERLVILDYSANTHKNDPLKIQDMINSISKIDSRKHKIIFKSQLFTSAGDNIPCTHDSFDFMYNRCRDLGYQCTASVFDKESMDFLLKYDIPFIKISNGNKLPALLKYETEIIFSCPPKEYFYNINTFQDTYLCCVSEYPAKIEAYPEDAVNLSDHTEGLDLWFRNKPLIWEKHLKMKDDTGLDSGSFAITPEELARIL